MILFQLFFIMFHASRYICRYLTLQAIFFWDVHTHIFLIFHLLNVHFIQMVFFALHLNIYLMLYKQSSYNYKAWNITQNIYFIHMYIYINKPTRIVFSYKKHFIHCFGIWMNEFPQKKSVYEFKAFFRSIFLYVSVLCFYFHANIIITSIYT